MTVKTSRAMVVTEPGRMELREFPLPEIGEEDGLLRVERVGVCGTDPGIFKGKVGRATGGRRRSRRAAAQGGDRSHPILRFLGFSSGLAFIPGFSPINTLFSNVLIDYAIF